MSVQYACDQCTEITDADAAVGWVEVRAVGGHLLHRPEPHYLCRLCWARMSATELSPVVPDIDRGQVSEHTQSRDTVQ